MSDRNGGLIAFPLLRPTARHEHRNIKGLVVD
jgi:hypothetical protein